MSSLPFFNEHPHSRNHRIRTLLLAWFVLLMDTHLYAESVPLEYSANRSFLADSIPWEDLSLTEADMKPLLALPVPPKTISPVIPILGGVAGAGALIYVIAHNPKEEDCSFTASISTIPSSCDQSNGVVSVATNIEATYAWSNGSTAMSQSAIPAGDYQVTVTRTGTSCHQVLQATVTNVDIPITTTITTTSADCGRNNGMATPSVNPPSLYTYAWSNGSTEQIQQNLAPGTYTLTVTGQGTCTDVETVTIGEFPPEFTVTLIPTPANCGSANGSLEAIVNPPGAYAYMWSNGATEQILTNVSSGSYTVTVTLQTTACMVVRQGAVLELPALFNITATSTPSACTSPSGTATAIVDIPGDYTYVWSDGQVGSQAIGLASGHYSVTVTLNGTNCSKTSDILVGELPGSFSVTLTGTPSGCGEGTGTASASVDPPGEYVFQWSDGQTGSQIDSLPPGIYTVQVTLSGSTCTVSGSILIEQIMPSFLAAVQVTPADCGLSNGAATVTVDPPGMYTYQWSNQQTGSALQNVPPGMYTVTVTDLNSCTAQLETTITENPAAYVDILSTSPANCTGSGEIQVILYTNGPGPIELTIVSPGGPITQVLTPGIYPLSVFLNILPGPYTLIAFDQSSGAGCMETEITTVADVTPVLQVNNDFYTTPAGQSLSGNMLQNDIGLNLLVTSISNASGGNATFLPSGEFVFVPANGFTGDAMFTYTVTDGCGHTGTGIVTIAVEQVPCTFTIQTTTDPAHCGISDGYINLEVNEPGTYIFIWDNGETGPELVNVPAGSYLVTIQDVTLGCELEFEIVLAEIPPFYIDDVEVTQPACADPAEISFVLSVPGPPVVFTMSVDHPNGVEVFFVPPGLVQLSDYIPLTPGAYTIAVYIEDPVPGCVDEIEVTLDPPQSIVLQVINVFPPSSPPALDGRAVIAAIVPGVLPYQVFLNGLPHSTANSQTFQINNLGVGSYTVHVIDQTGCLSNIVNFEIPPPDMILSFGIACEPILFDAARPEQATPAVTPGWNMGIVSNFRYLTGNVYEQIRFFFTPDVRHGKIHYHGWFEAEHSTEFLQWKTKQIEWTGAGGMGFRKGQGENLPISPIYYSLHGNTILRLGKYLQLEGQIAVRGWGKPEKPAWMVSVSWPLVHP